jgi:putative ABC transport system permease protein
MNNSDSILITRQAARRQGDRVRPVLQNVRNLVVPAGRFLDAATSSSGPGCVLLTEKLAYKLYEASPARSGRRRKSGERFTVIGTFKERVESFGQSEVSKESVLIPITVLKYFTDIERIDPMYASQVRQ